MNTQHLKHLKRLAVVGVAAAIVTTAVNAAQADHSPDPAAHPVPVLDYGLSSKAIVVKLHMTGDNAATMQDADVIYGRAPGTAGNPPLLDMTVYDDKGLQAQHFDEWDPRWVELEGGTPGTF